MLAPVVSCGSRLVDLGGGFEDAAPKDTQEGGTNRDASTEAPTDDAGSPPGPEIPGCDWQSTLGAECRDNVSIVVDTTARCAISGHEMRNLTFVKECDDSRSQGAWYQWPHRRRWLGRSRRRRGCLPALKCQALPAVVCRLKQLTATSALRTDFGDNAIAC